jgi:hypothetical protein
MDTTADVIDPHLSRRQMRRIMDRYRVTSGKGFRLKDHDPADTAGHLLPKSQANAMLAHGVERLAELKMRGRCCACFRRWMRPARTARSST